MKVATADRHNFGQHVKPMEGASCLRAPVYFQKPRTVFWEELFFGNSSPLRSIFSVLGRNSGLLVHEALFNLEVQSLGEWSGASLQVLSAPDDKFGLDLFSRFGMLLGYAYVFGIRDLHYTNVVRTKTNLQVIDAEVVLTDLVLPHETLLLPFKEVAWKDCGLSLLADSAESLTPEQTQAILAGYVDVMAVIDERRDEILAVFESLDLSAPIRIILRNTGEYTSLLKAGSFDSLLDGERMQMERQDIPYFFKRLGSNEVFWVSGVNTDRSYEFAALSVGSAFGSDVARHAVDTKSLLMSRIVGEGQHDNRIEERLLRGIAYLQKHLGGSGQFNWRDKILNFKNGSLTFQRDGS